MTTAMPQQQRPQLEKTRSTRSISLIGEWCPEEEGLDSSTRSSSSGSRRYSVEIPSSSSHLQLQTHHRRVSLPHPNNNRRPILSSTTSSARRSDHLRRQLSNDTQNNNTRQKTEEPIFYSINTMLHQQEDECWDNNNVDNLDRSNSSRRRLIRKDSQSSIKTYRHSNSSSRRLLSSTNNLSTKSRRTKSVSFPPNHEQLITAIHIIPKPSSTEIHKLYYTNDEILHMKKIYQYNVKKRVGKSIKEFGNKMRERLARNVDDDLSVECIVNAGENLISLSAKSEEYYNDTKSSGNTKMGGVIERASSTLPSMITLLL